MTIDTQHPLAGQHVNQGSLDAAADAYEGEYLRAEITRLARTGTSQREIAHRLGVSRTYVFGVLRDARERT